MSGEPKAWKGKKMGAEEFLKGESRNVEYKSELPKKSERYMKSVIAFANTSGGKLIIGIEDGSNKVVGVDKDSVFQIMDGIANAVSDCCEPQIIPDITFQNIDGKCVVVVSIYPGVNRPYYLKSAGKDQGVYVRVAGTSRLADSRKIRELEIEGANLSWDELVCVGYPVTEQAVSKLCQDIYGYMLRSVVSEEEKKEIPRVTKEQLINWKLLKKSEERLLATNGFVLLTSDSFPFARIQCALFKGNDRDEFIDKKEYTGPLYEQIEGAYQFVLRHINRGAEIDGLVRKEQYELPTGAIREMIINAQCHRNFMDDSCIQAGGHLARYALWRADVGRGNERTFQNKKSGNCRGFQPYGIDRGVGNRDQAYYPEGGGIWIAGAGIPGDRGYIPCKPLSASK